MTSNRAALTLAAKLGMGGGALDIGEQMRLLIFSLGIFLAVSVKAAKSKMVYMQEGAAGRHIILADADGKNAKAITSGPEWNLYPDIDSKGRWIVFVRGTGEAQQDIFAYQISTGVLIQWTDSEPGLHLHPDLSGDGHFVAFSGPYGENGKNQIVVWPVDAESHRLKPNARNVVESEFPSYFPALSSDGGVLYFQRSKSTTNRDIVRYDLASGQIEVLTDTAGNSMAPALSFDDRYLVYTSLVEGNWDIYRMDLQTRVVKRITSAKSKDYAPTFRPDGTIVFASDRTGRFQLYEVDPACTKQGEECEKSVVTGEGDLYAPSVSGDTSVTQELLAEMPHPARSSFGAAASAETVYAVGGHMGAEHTYPPHSFSGALSIYIRGENYWEEREPRPNAAHGFGVVQYGRYLYAFGGFAYEEKNSPKWKSIKSIDRFDLEEETWSQIGELPRARSSNVVVQVGNKVYLIGGWDATPRFAGDLGGTFHREIDVFDLTTEKMESNVASLPDPLRRAFTGAVKGEEIYLLGGITQGGSHFDLVDRVTVFNTRTKAWRDAPNLPFATFAPAAGFLNNSLLIFGGMHKLGEDFAYVNHVYQLPLNGKSWAHTGRYLHEAKGFSQVVDMGQGKLGILGGHVYRGDQNFPVTTFESIQ